MFSIKKNESIDLHCLSVYCRRLQKQPPEVFLQISQISRRPGTLLKKTPTQVFSFEICETPALQNICERLL